MDDNKMIIVDFCRPSNIQELAVSIGISVDSLQKKVESDDPSRLFIKHEIPKKNRNRNNEKRVVWEVMPCMEDCYKSFTRRFDLFARHKVPKYPHPVTYGYIRGRGILENAYPHCNAFQILHADIKNFFPSITRDRLERMFLGFGIQPAVAQILGKFVTIFDTLPLGLHSSPMLSNLICLGLDDDLQMLASGYKCKYTRYADDISISGNGLLPNKGDIENILGKNHFKLAEDKFRFTKRGQAHYVTGLSVDGNRPRAPRKMKRRLRQEIYYCNKFGIINHIQRIDHIREGNYIQRNVNRVDGMVRYVSHIERISLGEIQNKWKSVIDRDSVKVVYGNLSERMSVHFNFYVDESEIEFNNRKYLALSLVKVRQEDEAKIADVTLKVYRDHMADPFAAGNKEGLEKNGLHFADSPEDLRKAYIDKLAMFDFRSYIVYREMKKSDKYSEIYLSLINEILPDRFVSCGNSFVNISFEENSKVKKDDIRMIVNSIQDSLVQINNRYPILGDINIAKKEECVYFTLPDFLLGFFSRYARLSVSKSEDRENKFFEKIRDKYRVIRDADNNINFSRRYPFLPWVK